MPKDEFDFDDPFELNGMAMMTHEDTTNDMAACFIEEFMRMGYNHKQVLALFRNPHYVGPNMAWEKRGEPFVRELIAEIFARWGRPAVWSDGGSSRETGELPFQHSATPITPPLHPSVGPARKDSPITDPMGAPAPDFTI
jgi:hypothetical protein